jgi:PAS domain S-box-containing protein
MNSRLNRSGKPNLLRMVYLYPVVFFMTGLVSLFLFFLWQQIADYQEHAHKLEKDFTIHQREDLKLKVLSVKEYFEWARSNSGEVISQNMIQRMDQADKLIRTFGDTSSLSATLLTARLRDTLDKLSRRSSAGVVLLNDRNEIIYPDESGSPNLNLRNPVFLEASESNNWDSLLKVAMHKADAFTLFVRKSEVPGIRIGIAYNPVLRELILQETLLDSVEKINYSNNEYIFINTFSGFALLSKGQRQIPAQKILGNKEAYWAEIFKKEKEIAQSPQGGYLVYLWRNREDTTRSEKTSYFSGINDWEWIIGTGFFNTDIIPLKQELKHELWIQIRNDSIRFSIFILIIGIISFLFMNRLANKTRSNLRLFLRFFGRAAEGKQLIDKNALAFNEFDILAQAANQMIIEREKTNAVLETERSRLRYMIDAIPDLIFFTDSDMNFLGCNAAFARYNNISESGVKLSEYFVFPGASSERTHMKTNDDSVIPVPERSTHWVENSEGRRSLIETLKTPYFDSSNRFLGIIGISRDITEMEETRQRLVLAKEKAEESDRLKTAFLANMSHEIRTPMNAIIGFSDLLAEDDLTPEEKADFISKIKMAGGALMSLINDIIDIAKIEAGQLKISESECDLNSMLTQLHGTFNELRNSSGKPNLEISLRIPEPESRLMIYTDPMRLQQILTNLLSNALKFTENGNIEFGYNTGSDFITIYVKDTGIGILPSHQKILFQRFSQIDPSSTRRYGGAGLGLAISRNLVELLGGTINVESTAGHGSLFYFTIPYRLVSEKIYSSAVPGKQSVNWRGKTILVAEDMIQNYTLLQALLRRTGVRLLHALNGQIAIDTVKSQPEIDLILMDIQLPIKTGYEALKEILEIRKDIPVISYTAFALPHEREKSLNAGFADFIPKPIKAETLIPKLDFYLREQGSAENDISGSVE